MNITKNKIPNNERTYNCVNKDFCPLYQQCLTTCIIYQADLTLIENPKSTKSYIGIRETSFKKRYANHKKAFNIGKYKNDTALSKELWKIKEQNHTPIIKWKIIRKCSPYKANEKTCLNEKICLNEKTEIITFKGNNLLNQRHKLISKCKFLLTKFDTNKLNENIT